MKKVVAILVGTILLAGVAIVFSHLISEPSWVKCILSAAYAAMSIVLALTIAQ